MSFNIKTPYVIATHLKKFASTASLLNKTKAGALGFVSNVLYQNTGAGAVAIAGALSGITPVAVTAATVTLGALHVGRTTVLKRAAGLDATLPAATGTGNVYQVVIGDAGNAYTIATAPVTDFMQGVVIIPDSDDTAPAVPGRAFSSAATSNKMSMTTAGGGGLAGDFIELEDYASGLWLVKAVFKASSVPATPFSHV